jgi:DeoR/GlpR family transcriptional regulator of sugar metabolism
VGAVSLAWIEKIRFDMAFIGASGVDPLAGPCTTELGEMAVKQAAIRNSRRVILLADASKWRTTAPLRFAQWEDIDMVYSDHQPTPAELDAFSSNKVQFNPV